jgi:hypothetical protein
MRRKIPRLNYNQIARIKNFFVITTLLVISCAGTKEVVKEDIPQQNVYQYDESFDPLTLEDDDILIEGDENIAAIFGAQNISEPEKITAVREINGFRVQILATKNIETASLFEQEASERFGHLDHKTYLIFEAPLYRIRVGDCKERAEAEELRDLATQYGYRESFIVKSKIQIQE